MAELVLGPLLRHVDSTSATVWVETDAACTVEVAGGTQSTFRVGDQHFALVTVTGLDPGTAVEYDVRLDGEPVWPRPDSGYPPSRIHTHTVDQARHRIVFGSCRGTGTSEPRRRDRLGPDALAAYARTMAGRPAPEWPTALVLLGDQVYADEPTPHVREHLRAHADPTVRPVTEVVTFDEYAELYHEAWAQPDVRWLLSTVPTSMIFDDHDIRDDWNTSAAWRRQMAATPWWRDRIRAGLASYWVYQHIGNLTPAELDADPTYTTVRAADPETDVQRMLEDFAERADAEVDGAKPVRWSYRRDLGRSRLLVIDTRCGRILDDGARSMVGDAEFDWIERNAEGELDHLLVGSSLPWLMPYAVAGAQTLNESACRRTGPRGRLAERVRQAVDLEHWPAFRESFDRLSRLLARIADGAPGHTPPGTVSVLSGDVHHSYVARAEYPDPPRAPVYQLTCSPMRNLPPPPLPATFRLGWSRALATAFEWLQRRAGVPPPALDWVKCSGPHFGNTLAILDLDGRAAQLVLHRAWRRRRDEGLVAIAHVPLSNDAGRTWPRFGGAASAVGSDDRVRGRGLR